MVQIQLLPGCGIAGDCQAQPGSPRQVLMVDLPTLNAFSLQPGDLGENILLSQGLAMVQSGQSLQIGTALIRLTFHCEPCGYLESVQPGLTKRIGTQRGWLGMVVAGGTIALDDQVMVSHPSFEPIPDDAKSRFHQFVNTIPMGKVVTTKHVVLAIGVTSSYYRAIPGWLKRAAPDLPVHRVVAIDGSLFTQHLPHQAQQLSLEGIEITNNKVPSTSYWTPTEFYPAMM
jgi:alkylated DNA nucleotide flippase Atl1